MIDIFKELKVGYQALTSSSCRNQEWRVKGMKHHRWREKKKKRLCWQSHTVAYLPRTLCRTDCLLLSKAQEAIKRCRLCSPADPLFECVLFSMSRVRMIVICDKTAQARWRAGQECVWRLKRETRLEGRVAQMLLVYSWLKLLQLHFQNHKASLSTEL